MSPQVWPPSSRRLPQTGTLTAKADNTAYLIDFLTPFASVPVVHVQPIGSDVFRMVAQSDVTETGFTFQMRVWNGTLNTTQIPVFWSAVEAF